MAQHDYTIANQGFPAFRSDLNDALAAIVSNNSGATEPTTMFAHQMWVDTAADPSILKIRNADNDAWITIGSIDQTGDTFTLTSAVSATTLNTSGAVVFNDAGADVDFRVEGDTDANLLFVDASADAVGIGTNAPVSFASKTLEIYGSSSSTLKLTNATTGTGNTAGHEFESSGNDITIVNRTSSGYTRFFNNGSERMRITSAGSLALGTTSVALGYKMDIQVAGGGGGGIRILGASGDLAVPSLTLSKFDNNTTSSQIFVLFAVNNGASASGKIVANGANQAAFASTSDIRLKENVVDLDPQLERICALRPVEFDYIEEQGGGHQIGFVAQEMQKIYADCVSEDETENAYLSISGWSKTEARLVKAIQELKAELDTVKAELATLKG